jgi:membrane-associated phospholipid phosphatase
MFAAVAALACHRAQSQTARALIWALASVATALVGFSRIELGFHWMTDVTASLIWTSVWILVIVKVSFPKTAVITKLRRQGRRAMVWPNGIDHQVMLTSGRLVPCVWF